MCPNSNCSFIIRRERTNARLLVVLSRRVSCADDDVVSTRQYSVPRTFSYYSKLQGFLFCGLVFGRSFVVFRHSLLLLKPATLSQPAFVQEGNGTTHAKQFGIWGRIVWLPLLLSGFARKLEIRESCTACSALWEPLERATSTEVYH